MDEGADRSGFEDEWRVVETRVRKYCERRLRDDSSLVDDAFSATQHRAWRGYASFQRRSSFLNWVLVIASREVSRVNRGPVVPLPPEEIPEPPALPPGTPEGRESLAKAISDAVAAGILPRRQGEVLYARLWSDDPSWEYVGSRLGIAPKTCAVLHLRGVLKLRVFLFLNDVERLGGVAEIRRAAQQASSAKPPHRLTDKEFDVLETFVLGNQTHAPTRTQLVTLRDACSKVIRFLSLQLA